MWEDIFGGTGYKTALPYKNNEVWSEIYKIMKN